MKTGLERFHPVNIVCYFILVIVMGFFYADLQYIAASVIGSSLYYIILEKKKVLVYFLIMFLVASAIIGLNMIWNPEKQDALWYGLNSAGIFITIMNWFHCLNKIMNSERLEFLFSRMFPRLGLIFTMSLLKIKTLQKETKKMIQARDGIGLTLTEKTFKKKLRNSLAILTILSSWTLEHSVILADSMRSRGYGEGNRSFYSIYRFETRDQLLSMVMGLGVLGLIYYKTRFPSYILLLLIPSLLYLMERIKWKSLKSNN